MPPIKERSKQLLTTVPRPSTNTALNLSKNKIQKETDAAVTSPIIIPTQKRKLAAKNNPSTLKSKDSSLKQIKTSTGDNLIT